MYSKRLYEAGAIPIGLVLNDFNVSDEQLELCDAFLWPGGSRVAKKLYKILYHAYTNKKPVLGICLGMQAMCIFSTMIEEIINNNLSLNELTADQFKDLYANMAQNNPTLVKIADENIKSIHDNYVTKTENKHAYHKININDNTFLESVYGSNRDVVHLHSVEVKRVGALFNVVALSEDNVIEAVESKDPELNWVGVQFHPEFDETDTLIKELIKKIK